MEDNPILKQDPHERERVKQLLSRYQRVFTDDQCKVGRTSYEEFRIRLEAGAKPVRSKLRPMGKGHREELEQQLSEWSRDGVIQPSTSDWASALVPVRKKDGSTRWCVDFRGLNSVTTPEMTPVPRIDAVLSELSGSRIFSTLDASSAYHCIPVEEASRPLTAFITPYGLYEFARMPFD